MRTLLPPPDAILDPATRALRAGSYRGGLPRVDVAPLAPGVLERVLRHKRWLWLAIAAEDVFLAAAVVRLGYVANVFAYAYDLRGRRMLAVRKALGPPFAVHVGDTAGPGGRVRATLPGVHIDIERPVADTALIAAIELPGLGIFARLDTAGAPPAISAVGEVPGGSAAATEKRVLLGVTGEAVVAGRRIPLHGAVGGYDYTSGLLPRHTAWRWAFALGRARSGEPVALNLVEGMLGEAECALWVGGELVPLAEGRFAFGVGRPLEPWEVRTADGAVDLRFHPGAMHADRTNLGLVRARFFQPVGTFSGTVALPGGRTLELDGVPGVTEEQDVLW